MRRRFAASLSVALLLLTVGAASPAAATVTTTTWTGNGVSQQGIGSWTDTANWDNGVPTTGEDVVIAPATLTDVQDVPAVSLHDLALQGSGGSDAGLILTPASSANVTVTGALHWSDAALGEGLTLELAAGATGLADPSIDQSLWCVVQGQFKVDAGATFELREPGTMPNSAAATPFQIGAGSIDPVNGRIVVQGTFAIDAGAGVATRTGNATIEVDDGGTLVGYGPDPAMTGSGTASTIFAATVDTQAGGTLATASFPSTGTEPGHLQFLGSAVHANGPGTIHAAGNGHLLLGPSSRLTLADATIDLSSGAQIVLGAAPVDYSYAGSSAHVRSSGAGDRIVPSAPGVDGGTVRLSSPILTGTGLTLDVPTAIAGGVVREPFRLGFLGTRPEAPNVLSGDLVVPSTGALHVTAGTTLCAVTRAAQPGPRIDLDSSTLTNAGLIELSTDLTVASATDGTLTSSGRLVLGEHAMHVSGPVAVASRGKVRSTLVHVNTFGWSIGQILGGEPIALRKGTIVVTGSGDATPKRGTAVTLFRAATSIVGRPASVKIPKGWSLARTPSALRLVA
jgi:hypothetical protein